MLRGRVRLFWGFCPKCNSDAPEKQNCNICDDFYGYARDNKILKHKWWSRYENRLRQNKPK
jgi:hypothetical protein